MANTKSDPDLAAKVDTYMQALVALDRFSGSILIAREGNVLMSAGYGLANREHFRKAYIEPLVKAGWLERTIPNKPQSRNQKYRLTDKGREVLERINQ